MLGTRPFAFCSNTPGNWKGHMLSSKRNAEHHLDLLAFPDLGTTLLFWGSHLRLQLPPSSLEVSCQPPQKSDEQRPKLLDGSGSKSKSWGYAGLAFLSIYQEAMLGTTFRATARWQSSFLQAARGSKLGEATRNHLLRWPCQVTPATLANKENPFLLIDNV